MREEYNIKTLNPRKNPYAEKMEKHINSQKRRKYNMQKNEEKTLTMKDKWQQDYYKHVVEAIL